MQPLTLLGHGVYSCVIFSLSVGFWGEVFEESGVRVQGRSRPCPLSVGLNSISLKPTLAHHPLSLDE